MKKYRLIDRDDNIIWTGVHAPMFWSVRCEGNGKSIEWYETREEAISAVVDALDKNTSVTIEAVWRSR